MKKKIKIGLLLTASFLFAEKEVNAQTCGTSQVTYSGSTSNYLPKWNATAGCISNSTIFDNAGKVGVGLNDPNSLFHVAGQICTGIPYVGKGGASATLGSLLFYNTTNNNTVTVQSGGTTGSYIMTLPLTQGAAGTLLTNNGSGVLAWMVDANWHTYGNTGINTPATPATYGTSVFGGAENWMGTTDANDVVFGTNSIERMRIKQTTGNVGIGTASPNEKLELNGKLAFSAQNTDWAKIYLESSGDASYLSNLIFETFDNADEGFKFRASGNDMMFIRGDGNVGIGTTSPGVSLDINATGTTFFRGAYSGGQTLQFAAGASGTAIVQKGNGFLSFSTNSDGSLTAPTNERMRIDNTGNVGIGITNPTHTLEVNGTFYVNGVATCLWMAWSDSRIKTNIDSLHNALTTIRQLKPKSFYFDTANVYGLNFSSKKQYGFIAQDVETILPELISSTTKPADTLGTIIHPAYTLKTLNYNAFIGILTKGIQEQSNDIDSLKTKTTKQDSISIALQQKQQHSIDSLRQGLLSEKIKTNKQDSIITSLQNQMIQLASAFTDCCNSHGNHGNHGDNLMPSGDNNSEQNNRSMNVNNGVLQGGTTLTDVELSNKNMVVLNQNVPNPFAEQTTISYFLPDNVLRAQILFFEQSGTIIKAIDLTEKGKGQLNVFANDLTSGIYTYSLIVDGQTVETKKMIKAK